MFCNKCGKEVSDNAKFCVFCGAPVQPGRVMDTPEKPVEAAPMPVQAEEIDYDATVVVTESTPVQPPAGRNEQNDRDQRDDKDEKDDEATSMTMPVIPLADPNEKREGTPGGANAGAPNGHPVDTFPVPVVSGVDGQEKKKNRKRIIFGILIVLVAVLVALLVFLARAVFGGSDAAKRVIYLKDDELSAILDITAKEPVDVELEKIRSEDVDYSSMLGRYSDDGKYFYFFSKIDAEDNNGTLSCIEVDKLKKDESANGSCIKEIDSRVSLGSFSLIGNDSLVYMRKDDELWLYRGGETTELADSVGSYELTDDQKYIVYTEREDGDEDGDLYWIEVSENAKAEEIDGHVLGLQAVEGSDFIVYSKSSKDAYDYYVAGIDRSPSLVAEDALEVSSVDGNSFYYTVPESKELPLYGYVIDNYAESDAEAKEPDVRDYMKTVSAESAISSSDLSYYGSMSEFLDGQAYYDDASGLYSYYNYEKYENFYYDDASGTWYGDYNEDDYYAAMDDYAAVAQREELRTELKQGTVDQSYYTLYRYQDGKSEVVCENVASVSNWGSRFAVYTKLDLESPEKTYPIDEIGSADSLYNQIVSGDMPAEGEVYYCYVSGSSEEELSDFDSVVSAYLSGDGKTLVVEGNPSDGTYELVQYTVGSDGLGDGERITSEGSGQGFQENLFYYYGDISEDERDLYCYDNGEEKLIAKEAGGLVFLADDGTVVGITDWDSDHTSGDLTVFGEDGRGEDLVRDVEGFRYLGSGTYLFSEGGDLYYLDKKGEKTRLAKNITSYWYPGKLPGTWM